MSRFSIRTQMMAFAGTFLAVLVSALGALALLLLQIVGEVEETVSQTLEGQFINDIKEDLDQAMFDLLRVDRGEQEAWDSLSSNLTEVTELQDQVIAAFADADPGVRDTMNGLVARLIDMQTRLPEIQAQPSFAQIRELRESVLPVIGDDLAALDRIQEDMKTSINASLEETSQGLSTKLWILAMMSAISVMVAVAVGLLFGRLMSRPIVMLDQTVGRIADGDYAAEIPNRARRDEIGKIANRLETFREKLSESEARNEEERSLNERRVALFTMLGEAMSALKDGKLDHRIEAADWSDLGDSYVMLCEDFNGLSRSLQKLVASVRSSVETVETNAAELAGMSLDMSRRAEIQAATLEESAAALEELSTSVKSAAARAQEADEKVIEGRRRAQQGGEVMAQALSAMGSISKSSEQINQIIGVIDDIAFQTNLLALNAGVEAARAGESGKGFSVVASEVRSLAQRASESAKEIKDLVSTSSQQVDDGERLVEQTSATLQHIVESVTEVSDLVSEIANAAKEQAAGVQEITVGVGELDKVTQQNAALVNETSAAGEQLKREVASVSAQLAAFSGIDDAVLSDPLMDDRPQSQAPASGPVDASEAAMPRSPHAGLPTNDVGWSSDDDIVPAEMSQVMDEKTAEPEPVASGWEKHPKTDVPETDVDAAITAKAAKPSSPNSRFEIDETAAPPAPKRRAVAGGAAKAVDEDTDWQEF
jgi:methyl-accepting chemotaxis protein